MAEKDKLKNTTKKQVIDSLKENNHNMARTAEDFGVTREAIRQYLKRNGLRLSTETYIIYDKNNA